MEGPYKSVEYISDMEVLKYAVPIVLLLAITGLTIYLVLSIFGGKRMGKDAFKENHRYRRYQVRDQVQDALGDMLYKMWIRGKISWDEYENKCNEFAGKMGFYQLVPTRIVNSQAERKKCIQARLQNKVHHKPAPLPDRQELPKVIQKQPLKGEELGAILLANFGKK